MEELGGEKQLGLYFKRVQAGGATRYVAVGIGGALIAAPVLPRVNHYFAHALSSGPVHYRALPC